jgi:NAD+ synthase (glutamine-hydrolysing)
MAALGTRRAWTSAHGRGCWRAWPGSSTVAGFGWSTMRLHISLAQINSKSGDIRGNSEKILSGVAKARQEGADVVVFPELCLTGYCLDEKLLINLPFLRANRRALMERIAPACQGIAAVVGFIDFEEDRMGPDNRVVRHNAAAVIADGRLLQVVCKRLLPSYRYFDDKRYFQPGEAVEPVVIPGKDGPVRVGVLICEDLWDDGYPLKPCGILARKGVDCIFCINASPFVGRRCCVTASPSSTSIP